MPRTTPSGWGARVPPRNWRRRNEPRRSRRLAGRPQHYDVGYGRPPTAHRFKKGQSGNPRGRPTGATARTPARPTERLKDLLLEEASRLITVHDGNQPLTLPMAQAVCRALVIRAVKGDPRAQRLFIENVTAIERERTALYDAFVKTAMDYKIAWEHELECLEQRGITDAPPILPHPDHIEFNLQASTARIVGPSTKEEQVVYDRSVAQEQAVRALLENLQDAWAAADTTAAKKQLKTAIDQAKAKLRDIAKNRPAQIGIG